MGLGQVFNRFMGERMAASGMMAMLEVTGRRSGRAIRTPVGYVRGTDGRVLVGAGRADSQWPRNLQATPVCRVRIGRDEQRYAARELADEERATAVALIHAKYGERAARVGAGPVFELAPVAASGSQAA
jgi:deazaflavin-dependent oxidoreductase (nitroreductase family)